MQSERSAIGGEVQYNQKRSAIGGEVEYNQKRSAIGRSAIQSEQKYNREKCNAIRREVQ
ncbi:hypothetical protein L195_g055318 [Trifolium pratense]|uniref:Uncharacterized protein n=1 Tax=Trifolium pratense TaxID=57577 RepID=A0A2K3KKQ3_TRIPR|nr:hypothetical protein L195_g055318 [Trifolium pratense]